MEQNEKVLATAERDRCWADLRGSAGRLSELIRGDEGELSPLDFLLFYQCIVIVLAEFMLFAEDFSDIAKSLDNKGPGGQLLRTLRETGYWKDMVDDKLAIEKRLKAVEKLRKSIWVHMFTKKDEIIKLQAIYPKIEEHNMSLMMQCVALVGLELDLKKREIELIDS